ncbi:NUDIX domain-containing protein [soil metagenome]
MAFTYEYPRPAVTVDVVLFAVRGTELSVLLIRRKHAPFRGSWALPGGFVDESESLEHAAARELEEETTVTGVRIEQLGAFGDPGRDPRGHTVSVAFWSFLHTAPRAAASDDAAEAQWMPLSSIALTDEPPVSGRGKAATKRGSRGLAELAFDHRTIINTALQRLRDRLAGPRGPMGLPDLVPARFTLGELQHVYQVALGRQIDRRNFRAKLIADKVVAPALGVRSGRHRPAQLYRFAADFPAMLRDAVDPKAKPKASRAKPSKAKKRKKPAQ